MGYLANFMVYTLAMIGVIAIALLVFKNANSFGGSVKSKHLKVLDNLSLAPRKTLYIVSTGKENFLIAGDVDKTVLISKLESANNKCENLTLVSENNNYSQQNSFKDTMIGISKSNYMDKSGLGITSSILNEKVSNYAIKSEKNDNNSYTSVMRSLASKMQNK